MSANHQSVRTIACKLIDALQCAPMTYAALAEECDVRQETVEAWVRSFKSADLVESCGRAAHRNPRNAPMLWKWKRP